MDVNGYRLTIGVSCGVGLSLVLRWFPFSGGSNDQGSKRHHGLSLDHQQNSNSNEEGTKGKVSIALVFHSSEFLIAIDGRLRCGCVEKTFATLAYHTFCGRVKTLEKVF